MTNLPDLVREEIPALTVACFRATRRGLIITGDPTLEDCAAYLRGLMAVGTASPVLMGDVLAHMERRYGDTYVQAVELYPNHALSTLQSYRWICAAVPYSNRLEDCSISHLREVASLPIGEQRGWLMKAKEEEWGRSALRAAIRGATEPGYDPWVEKLERLVVTINNLSLEAEDEEDIDALLMARDIVRDRIDARKEA